MISEAMNLILGRWFGLVYPPKEPDPLPASDARDHSLRRFRDFLAFCVFSRKGDAGGPAIAFQVPKERIHLEQPDDPQRLIFPSIAFVPGRGLHDTYRLGPFEQIEETRDVYAPGTVVLDQGWYEEEFTIEVWADHPAERLAIVAGLKSVLRLSQRSYALQLTLPSYFDQVAQFSLEESQNVDDPSVILGRRRAQVFVQLGVPECTLVNATTLEPHVVVNVVDSGGSLDDAIDPAG